MRSICLYFTKYDTDILAWVNMLRENGLSPATWIQAAIVSEDRQSKLDIGSVVPTPPPSPKSALFGDDTRAEGSYVIGSRLNIRVTRKIVQDALGRVVGEREMTAPVIKMILRKNIGFLSQFPNVPPDPMQLQDFFVRGTMHPPQIKNGINTITAASFKDENNLKREVTEPLKHTKQKNPLLGYIT